MQQSAKAIHVLADSAAVLLRRTNMIKIKYLTAISLAACAMLTLSGCKHNKNITSEPVSTTSSASDVGIDGDPEVLNDVKVYSDETFDMRYKYWYDNPEVINSQKEILALAKSGTETGRKHLNLFPLYKDENNLEYYISGREMVYVPSGTDTHGLSKTRDENGKLHYSYLTGTTGTDFLQDFLAVTGEQNQSTTYEDYASDTTFAELEDGVDYQVFINNLATDITFNTVDAGIPLNKWFVDYNLLSIDNGDYTVRNIYLNTGAGIRTIQLEFYEDEDWESAWNVTYLEDAESVIVSSSEIPVFGDAIYVRPSAIERILGYKVQVYDNAIDIITDNRDLADKDSVMPELKLTVIVDPEASYVPKQPSKH